ncbi:MAG TPA: dihydrolipoamide acetyltransferase family protein [Dehalococcoidia bacterium]|nr:dihydrolipoamide acetyltransferase family protein [Dehalococcoidia bacterium]
MRTTVAMPQVGESVVEGTIGKWLKRVGEWVDRYEPLVEIITDKVNVELPSPEPGRLVEILVPEGMTVPIGAELAVLEVEAPTEAPPPPEAAPPEEALVGRRRVTPRVRRLAEELGVELEHVRGTGPGGRITEEDVRSFAAAPALGAPAAPAPREAAPEIPAEEEAVPVDPIRRTIAQRMAESKRTIPHAWVVMEADMTPLRRLRESIKEEFRRRHGVDITYLPFVIKAVVEALRQFPILNSLWAEDHITLRKRINVGVAVATDKGLLVPVIRDADQKSISGLALALGELASRAREGKLRLEDVRGGTFTINNPGAFGSIMSLSIINPPQAAILSMDAIVRRPVVVDDAIAIRSIMNLCLAFDHRILDGAGATAFLRAVKERLEGMGPSMPIY